MKCFVIATIINALLVGLSNCFVTPQLATEKYSEQSVTERNPNVSNDTLVFAQVVSVA